MADQDEFEPAFEKLIERCKAKPLHTKFKDLHILSRELFLLAEDDLNADADLKPKALMKLLKRNLETFQAFLDAGVAFPDEAADRVCGRWPTLIALRNSTWKTVQEELMKRDDGEAEQVSKELIDRVRTIHEKNRSKGDIQEAQEERKQRREEVKQQRESMKEMLDALKDIPGADAAAKLKVLEERFPAKMKELKDRGVLGDGSKLESLIKSEMDQLDKTLTDLGTVSASLEHLAARVDGGNLLRGLFLAKDGVRRGEALLLAADDSVYTVHNPSAPSEVLITHFKSTVEYEKVQSVARATGWSTAVAFSGGLVYTVETAASYETSTSSKTVDVNQTRTNTIVVSRQLSLPTLCLNFELSALRLGQAALTQLKQVGDRSTARSFLNKYGSHILTGVVTVGGRLEFVFQARSEESATVREFLRLESEKFSSKVRASSLSFGSEASYGRSESKEEAERTKKFSENCITTTELKAYGPPVSDLGLFIKTVNDNACYWHVLSRGCPSCRLAVWDIARQHSELQDDTAFQDSVDMVEHAWRMEMGHNGNPLLWQAQTSDTLEQQRTELRDWLLYVCRVSGQLYSLGHRARAFCENVQRGTNWFDNSDFLGDILTSRNASTNDVVQFLRAVAASSDIEAKTNLAKLLSGHLGCVIRRSFSDPEDILQKLDLPQVPPVNCPPICNVSCTQGRVSWDRVGGALGYEVQMAGPYDEKVKNAEEKEGDYQSVYQGSATIWMCNKFTDYGVYRFRVRGQYDAGWCDFSPPVSFLHTGAVMAWDAHKRSPDIVVSLDDDDLKRVARHNGEDLRFESVLGLHALKPQSSLLPASKCSFEVKVVRHFRVTIIGVCRALPLGAKVAGMHKDYGIGYGDGGGICNDGVKLSGVDGYRTGDVIRVEVDFEAQFVSFFKNNKRQGDPILLCQQDRNQPLYAAVTLCGRGSEVHLL